MYALLSARSLRKIGSLALTLAFAFGMLSLNRELPREDETEVVS